MLLQHCFNPTGILFPFTARYLHFGTVVSQCISVNVSYYPSITIVSPCHIAVIMSLCVSHITIAGSLNVMSMSCLQVSTEVMRAQCAEAVAVGRSW